MNTSLHILLSRTIGYFLLLLVSFTIISTSVYTQTDSLINELEVATSDSIRLQTLMKLSGKLYRSNPDKGIEYSLLAKDLATQLQKKEDLAYALKNIGLAYYFKSDFPEALKYWSQSLEAFEAINHKEGISNILSNLGAVYESKGDYPKALKYAIQSLKIAEEDSNQLRITTSLINIAAIYAEDENTWPQAQQTLEDAIAKSTALDAPDLSGTAALNLGELLLFQKKPEEALPYFEKSLQYFNEIGGHAPTAMDYIGKTQNQLGNYSRGLEFAKGAFKEASKTDSEIEMSLSLITKAQSLKGLKRYYEGIATLNQAEQYSIKLGTNDQLIEIYEELSQMHSLIGNHELAYNYGVKFGETKDIIRNDEYDKQVNNLRFQLDLETKEKEIEILNRDNALQESEISRAGIIQKFLLALGALMLIIIGGVSYLYRYSQKTNKLLAEERNRFEKILLNILPKDTADELQQKGYVDAKKIEMGTVLFTDFKSFTKYSDILTPEHMVKSIDFYFSKFDEIIGRYNLEKIKTIGDAYMCAGGLPTKNKTNAKDAVLAALEIASFVQEVNNHPPEGIHPFQIRIGINTGQLVAGIVGTKKFQYDIWGSAVNVASRMESACEEGRINISDHTYELIKDDISCNYRGEIEVKNGLHLKMYYVDQEEYIEFKHNLDFRKENILN